MPNIIYFMDTKYICYCGLYCENCHVRAKVNPAAKTLYDEMNTCGFGEIIHFIPGGDGFWPFLKNMAENGICNNCKDGGGNPGCAIRLCAREKNVEMCALCESYPCGLFERFFDGYPTLRQDNTVAQEQGLEAWGKLQDERRKNGFTYTEAKTPSVMP